MKDWIPSYTEEELREAFEEAGQTDDLSSMSLDRKQGRDKIGHFLFHRIHAVNVITESYDSMFRHATSEDAVSNISRVANNASMEFATWRNCNYWISVGQFVRYAMRKKDFVDVLDNPQTLVGNIVEHIRSGTALTKYMPAAELEEFIVKTKKAIANPRTTRELKIQLQELLNGAATHEGQYPITNEDDIQIIARNVARVLNENQEAVRAYYTLGMAFTSISDALHTITGYTQHDTPPELTQPLSYTLEGKAAQDAIEAYKVGNP